MSITAAKNPPAITATPPDRPSILSSMLKAFTAQRIQPGEGKGQPGPIEKDRELQVFYQQHAGGGRRRLHKQPQPPVQSPAVVRQAEQHQHRTSGKQHPQLGRLGGDAGEMRAGEMTSNAA